MSYETFSFLPAFLGAPLAYLFRRQQSYTKTVNEHSIQIKNHDEKFEKMCERMTVLTDKMETTNINLSKLTGVLEEMHHHNHDN